MSKPGHLIVLSAPSGCGKSTVIRALMERRPDFKYGISSTTRSKRSYEIEGLHYNFVTREEFERGIAEGRFLEWAEVHGELYGTPLDQIQSALADGSHVILDLDVNGGGQIAQKIPETKLIFLYPPSLDELRRRLRLRGTDADEDVEKRLSRYPLEKERSDKYPYHIVNDSLDDTIAEVINIIETTKKPKGHKSVSRKSTKDGLTENHNGNKDAKLSESEELEKMSAKQRATVDRLASTNRRSLPWLVGDFSNVTPSVYEAVMIAALRARQIGRRQKREIDAWMSTLDISEGVGEDDFADATGVDHFHHPKPTVQALAELHGRAFVFSYPEKGKKQ